MSSQISKIQFQELEISLRNICAETNNVSESTFFFA